jgi:hypothetical protein
VWGCSSTLPSTPRRTTSRCSLQLAADSLVARLLTLTGLDTALPVTTDPVGPFAATVRADPLCAAAPRRAVAAIQATASSG